MITSAAFTYADELEHAWLHVTAIAPLTTRDVHFDVDAAYAVQRELLRRRVVAGAVLVGHKIGITSKAVQTWLKVDSPDFGFLLDSMEVMDGGVCMRSSLCQPRVEGEIAFVLKRDLAGPGITAAHVIAATDFVLPAIEIIDSRIHDWKLTLADTVADNASSARFVLGTKPTKLSTLDLPRVGMMLCKNGILESTGAGAACLGNPVAAVVWLANELGRRGVGMRAGEVILSGALGPVSPVEAGDTVRVAIEGMGDVQVLFG